MKSGLDLRTFDNLNSSGSEDSSKIRNTELFPFLKEKIVIDSNTCKPAISIDDAEHFILIMG
jgi:hypothetical protein